MLDIYHPEHPRCCAADDICSWQLAKERAYANGVLLVDTEDDSYRKFLGIPPETEVVFREYTIKFRSQSGRTKEKTIKFAYIAPGIAGGK